MDIRQINTSLLNEIEKLYKDAKWDIYLEKVGFLNSCYSNSLRSYGYFEGEKLVGVIRLVGDGISIVYIQDLIVLESHKRNGIGRALVKTVLDHYSEVRQITLLADDSEELNAFYRSLGFKETTQLGMNSYYYIKSSKPII